MTVVSNFFQFILLLSSMLKKWLWNSMRSLDDVFVNYSMISYV